MSAELVSVAGLLMAMTLYAMLLVMVVGEGSRAPRVRSLIGGDSIALWTALLGLVWNTGAFMALHSSLANAGTAGRLVLAGAFSALGFLPALFVSAALRPWGTLERPGTAVVRTSAYALSLAAAILHAARVARHEATPSPGALSLLAVGYCALVPALLWVAPPEERVRRGFVSALGLLAFSFCAFHLTRHLPGTDTWSTAFFGHHASLPLVLAILYEDYRFAFADIFLKRALGLILLVGIVGAVYAGIAGGLEPFAPHTDPRDLGALVLASVATALAYPMLQRGVDRFVDAVVLSRPDYSRLRVAAAQHIETLESAAEVLDHVCVTLAPALNARFVRWSHSGEMPSDALRVVPVATTDPPRFVLEVGALTGGRRLLSDDVQLLESVALQAARRIDSVRMLHERLQRDVREQEIAKLATESELRALRAQLNPHFLFNALNTIGYLLRAAPDRALATLLDLTHLLRAVLKRADGDFVTLGQELELVGSYVAIERARFEDRLRVSIDVPDALRAWPIPPLIVQPLVENAIKHGIARRTEGGDLSVVARREADGSLAIQVADSGVGASEAAFAAGRLKGLGLANIEKRLNAYYGGGASLEITVGSRTQATVRLPKPSTLGREGAVPA